MGQHHPSASPESAQRFPHKKQCKPEEIPNPQSGLASQQQKSWCWDCGNHHSPGLYSVKCSCLGLALWDNLETALESQNPSMVWVDRGLGDHLVSTSPSMGQHKVTRNLDDGNDDVTVTRNKNEQCAATEQGSAPPLLPPSPALSHLWRWSGCTVNQLSTLKWLKISPGIRFKKKGRFFSLGKQPTGSFQSTGYLPEQAAWWAGTARASPGAVRLSVTQAWPGLPTGPPTTHPHLHSLTAAQGRSSAGTPCSFPAAR